MSRGGCQSQVPYPYRHRHGKRLVLVVGPRNVTEKPSESSRNGYAVADRLYIRAAAFVTKPSSGWQCGIITTLITHCQWSAIEYYGKQKELEADQQVAPDPGARLITPFFELITWP